jgi:SAM-dependent methyltransferase
MGHYYDDRLAGERLRECYELAPPRIRQYLDAEIRFVADRTRDARFALELGCGYGRVLREIARVVPHVVGCDISGTSLRLARSFTKPRRNVTLVQTDAAQLGFRSGAFDAVFCIQNGISAFGMDRSRLVSEAARVTRPGGHVLFSTYSPRIWEARLAWFRLQADAGLLGPIDETKTRDGTIVCRDGFRATTVGGEELTDLFERAGLRAELREIDESSLFCLART